MRVWMALVDVRVADMEREAVSRRLNDAVAVLVTRRLDGTLDELWRRSIGDADGAGATLARGVRGTALRVALRDGAADGDLLAEGRRTGTLGSGDGDTDLPPRGKAGSKMIGAGPGVELVDLGGRKASGLESTGQSL